MVASSPASDHGPDLGSVATSHIGGGAVWWKSPRTALARGWVRATAQPTLQRYFAPPRRECTPWAAEATSLLPAGPAACQWLASPVGRRQATGPRRRARPGRVAGDGQPARLGLLKRDERLLKRLIQSDDQGQLVGVQDAAKARGAAPREQQDALGVAAVPPDASLLNTAPPSAPAAAHPGRNAPRWCPAAGGPGRAGSGVNSAWRAPSPQSAERGARWAARQRWPAVPARSGDTRRPPG